MKMDDLGVPPFMETSNWSPQRSTQYPINIHLDQAHSKSKDSDCQPAAHLSRDTRIRGNAGGTKTYKNTHCAFGQLRKVHQEIGHHLTSTHLWLLFGHWRCNLLWIWITAAACCLLSFVQFIDLLYGLNLICVDLFTFIYRGLRICQNVPCSCDCRKARRNENEYNLNQPYSF